MLSQLSHIHQNQSLIIYQFISMTRFTAYGLRMVFIAWHQKPERQVEHWNMSIGFTDSPDSHKN